jgi:uncharacterized protein YjlB
MIPTQEAQHHRRPNMSTHHPISRKMPPTVHSYPIPPTPLIPNSPLPLLHYPGLLADVLSPPAPLPPSDSTAAPVPTSPITPIFNLLTANNWPPQWLARYAPTQPSHYHSTTHEAMVVVSGAGASIRFGAADDEPDRGIVLEARLGDVFILPAGLAHKTFAPRPHPSSDGIAFHVAPDPRDEAASRDFFEAVEVKDEFMMLGAYPRGGEWDFAVGGEHAGRFEQVWDVQVPERDPVLGYDAQGLCGLWNRK